jgi:hypothetical protein
MGCEPLKRTPAQGAEERETIVPEPEPGNQPEREPRNQMLPPDAEKTPERWPGVVSNPDF